MPPIKNSEVKNLTKNLLVLISAGLLFTPIQETIQDTVSTTSTQMFIGVALFLITLWVFDV